MNCDGCTLCCKLLDILNESSSANEWCKHCDPHKGCKIYEDRPEPCREYRCAWVQMKDANINLRPDRSKIIFDKVSDSVFCAVQHPDYKMKGRVKQQILSFLNNGFSVVVMHPEAKTKPEMYLADGHTGKDVWQQIIEQAKKVSGDST